jgi:hypothetical protein
MIVTVFDWDDTLMATTHLIQSTPGVVFPELSESIKKLITIALGLGHVYIITNAEIGWVQKCIDENLIDCEHILNRVHMLSTPDTGIAKITSIETRKTVAFSRIKGMFNKRGRMHHLICMGDCFYDREAALNLKERISEHTYVKNVKFLHRPDLETLLFQQKICIDTFYTLLMSPQHLDLMLTQESPLPSKFIMQYSSLSTDQASELSDLSELTEEEGDKISTPIEPETWCCTGDPGREWEDALNDTPPSRLRRVVTQDLSNSTSSSESNSSSEKPDQ